MTTAILGAGALGLTLAYRVVGLDVQGEQTDVLDDEVTVELQSTTSREDIY